jgi:glycosyltransferase involved in cell wall biosynthesis
MRIAIDLQGAQTGSRFRGIGRYSIALAQAIVRNRGDHEVIVALSDFLHETIEPVRAEFSGLLPEENILVWHAQTSVYENSSDNTQRREIAELLREAFLASLEPDVVLISSLFEGFDDDFAVSVGNLGGDFPVAVILYDLIPLQNPDEYLGSPAASAWYQNKVEHCRRAQLLLSISESARREGIEYLGAKASSIVNISTAVGAEFKPIKLPLTQQEQLRSKFDLTKDYLMYSGATDDRKNHLRLIAAYAKLPVPVRSSNQLVFVGGLPDVHRARFLRHAKKCGLNKGELIITGRVTDDELVALYNLCKAFIFPSWHEGFGLPALEAMSCGRAAICSNTSSLPEVVGRDDALFDPFDEMSIAEKIEHVLTDDDFRLDLERHGVKQSKKFSWDRSAKAAITAFENLSQPDKGVAEFAGVKERLTTALAKIFAAGKSATADIVETAKCIDINDSVILKHRQTLSKLAWRIEGPFDSSYSLALLNRETALALDSLGYDVALYSTEGPGDYIPATTFLNNNPAIKRLYDKSHNAITSEADVISRNLYPPRVDDVKGRLGFLHHYAWEESGFPQAWVQSFNEHLDGMTCLSRHVQKIMIDNGVSIPMDVSGCGVDHWERITASNGYALEAKKFRFLHVSSCFPRKGVDCLLLAYGKVFKASDDVSLVIKTFPNPHNKISQWLENVRKHNPDYPHVVVIEEDLTDAELKALYKLCDLLVAPTRAEGFGLPMAEAMLSGLPVITTAWSGQLDFCNEENSWLVDYEFEKAQTHFNLFLSAWAKPNIDALADAMCKAYSSTPELLASKALAGRNLLLQDFKWEDVAKRYVSSVNNVVEAKTAEAPKIAWLSTWGTKCGIATYSGHLIDNMPCQDVVVFAPEVSGIDPNGEITCVRNWVIGKENNDLHNVTEAIEARSLNTIIIQFNYSFYNHQNLCQFIDENAARGRNVIIMLHSTVDPDKELAGNKLRFIQASLKRCRRVLVHSVADLNRLKDIGSVENVALFPHGVLNYAESTPVGESSEPPLIACYGFCLPHKGIEELVEAVAMLRDQGSPVRLRLINAEHPAPVSRELVEKIKIRIDQLGLADLVGFNSQFLSDDESLALLSAADLIVFPYQQTGESSSAAVRYGLATRRPVAVTPLSIFDDISTAAFRFAGIDPASIAAGISSVVKALSQSSQEARDVQESSDRWREEFDYATVSRRLYGICSALLQQKHFKKH